MARQRPFRSLAYIAEQQSQGAAAARPKEPYVQGRIDLMTTRAARCATRRLDGFPPVRHIAALRRCCDIGKSGGYAVLRPQCAFRLNARENRDQIRLEQSLVEERDQCCCGLLRFELLR